MQMSQGFLRSYTPADLERMVAHFNTPDVYNMLRTPVPFSHEDALKRMASENLWVIDMGGFAGEIGIHSILRGHKAELFYSLSPEYWRRGIMTQAVKTISEWAFNEFQLIRLQAYVYSNNPASAHLLEQCGFEKEGLLRKDTIRLETILDRYIYALVR